MRQLAYEPDLFKRSVRLLCRYALLKGTQEEHNRMRDNFRNNLKSLFSLYWSGTHAPVEARAEVIEELVGCADQDRQELGLFLLDATIEDATMEASYFRSSFHKFDFGARPRDFGYWPKTREEVTHWYETFIGICTRLALLDQPVAEKAKPVLLDRLRGLWTEGGMFAALENSAKQIHKQQAWNEGWLAVRGIIYYDSRQLDEKNIERLKKLEKFLRPNNLLERVRALVLLDSHHLLNLGDDDDFDDGGISSSWKQAEKTIRKMGIQVAQDIETFNALLPALVSNHSRWIFIFGQGLAEGCSDKQELWQSFYAQFQRTPPDRWEFDISLGFLSSCAENDPAFYNSILDHLIDDDLLGEWFLIFQTTSIIDQRGVQRLHEALDNGKAKMHTFRCLTRGRVNDDDLADLLKKILFKKQGTDVVIQILRMKFDELKYSSSLMTVGREVLSSYSFDKQVVDSELAQIARICLNGDQEGIKAAAAKICQHLAKAITDNRIFVHDHPKLLNTLAHIQPFVFLDIFLESKERRQEYRRLRKIFDKHFAFFNNPLNQIPDDDLIAWCDRVPKDRYPLIALAILPFSQAAETRELAWKPIIYSLFEKAPDLGAVLKNLAEGMMPMSWSGSRADILQKRSVLFQSLYRHEKQEIRTWAREQYSALQEQIKIEREQEEREAEERRHNEQRFE